MILKNILKPKEGDTKTKNKFAWWPIEVENKLLWLEKYKVHYVYRKRKRVLITRWIYHEGVWCDWDITAISK